MYEDDLVDMYAEKDEIQEEYKENQTKDEHDIDTEEAVNSFCMKIDQFAEMSKEILDSDKKLTISGTKDKEHKADICDLADLGENYEEVYKDENITLPLSDIIKDASEPSRYNEKNTNPYNKSIEEIDAPNGQIGEDKNVLPSIDNIEDITEPERLEVTNIISQNFHEDGNIEDITERFDGKNRNHYIQEIEFKPNIFEETYVQWNGL